MNRRHFITMLSMAPVAVAAAKLLPVKEQVATHDGIHPRFGDSFLRRHQYQFAPGRTFQPGDVVVVSGCLTKELNGTYRTKRVWMKNNRVFEKVDV